MLPSRIIKQIEADEKSEIGRRVQFPANVKIDGFYTSRVIAGTITGFGTYREVHVKGDNGLTYAVPQDRVELL